MPSSRNYAAPPLPSNDAGPSTAGSMKLMPTPTRLNDAAIKFVVHDSPRGDIVSCPLQTNGAFAKHSIGIDTRWWAKTGQT